MGAASLRPIPCSYFSFAAGSIELQLYTGEYELRIAWTNFSWIKSGGSGQFPIAFPAVRGQICGADGTGTCHVWNPCPSAHNCTCEWWRDGLQYCFEPNDFTKWNPEYLKYAEDVNLKLLSKYVVNRTYHRDIPTDLNFTRLNDDAWDSWRTCSGGGTHTFHLWSDFCNMCSGLCTYDDEAYYYDDYSRRRLSGDDGSSGDDGYWNTEGWVGGQILSLYNQGELIREMTVPYGYGYTSVSLWMCPDLTYSVSIPAGMPEQDKVVWALGSPRRPFDLSDTMCNQLFWNPEFEIMGFGPTDCSFYGPGWNSNTSGQQCTNEQIGGDYGYYYYWDNGDDDYNRYYGGSDDGDDFSGYGYGGDDGRRRRLDPASHVPETMSDDQWVYQGERFSWTAYQNIGGCQSDLDIMPLGSMSESDEDDLTYSGYSFASPDECFAACKRNHPETIIVQCRDYDTTTNTGCGECRCQSNCHFMICDVEADTIILIANLEMFQSVPQCDFDNISSSTSTPSSPSSSRSGQTEARARTGQSGKTLVQLQKLIAARQSGAAAKEEQAPESKADGSRRILSSPSHQHKNSSMYPGWSRSQVTMNAILPFDPAKTSCLRSKIGDGFCDIPNNDMACGFDGGDCCSTTCSSTASGACLTFDCKSAARVDDWSFFNWNGDRTFPFSLQNLLIDVMQYQGTKNLSRSQLPSQSCPDCEAYNGTYRSIPFDVQVSQGASRMFPGLNSTRTRDLLPGNRIIGGVLLTQKREVLGQVI